VAQFKTDLPTVLDALRDMIEGQLRDNACFRTAAEEFLQRGQDTINPHVTDADVLEILTERSSQRFSARTTSTGTTMWRRSCTRWSPSS
jgi:hypothetical protein